MISYPKNNGTKKEVRREIVIEWAETKNSVLLFLGS